MRLDVHAALLLSQVILIVHPVMLHLALANDKTDPVAFALLRSSIAVAAKMAIAHKLYGVVPDRKHMRDLALTGVTGSAMYPLFFVLGMQFTTPVNACVIEATTPIFTALLAAYAGLERLNAQKLLGVGTATLGAMGMLGLFDEDARTSDVGRHVPLGNFFVLVSAVSYAGFIVAQKPVVNALPAITVTAWSSLFGGVAIAGVAFVKFLAFGSLTFDSEAVPGLMYASLVTTTIGYFLEGWANKNSSATLVSVYCTLQPVGAAVLSYLVLGEAVTLREGLFALLVFAGVWVVSLAPSAPAPAAQEKAPEEAEPLL